MELLVPILVAFIAGIVSFVGLVISKENKISEFRQTWIDELRKDISDYIAYTDKHFFYYKLTSQNNKKAGGSGGLQKEGLDLYLNEYHIVYSLYSRIRLRLSPKDEQQPKSSIVNRLYSWIKSHLLRAT
jgi:hypothetical protein